MFNRVLRHVAKPYHPPTINSIGHASTRGLRLVLLGAPGVGKGSYAKFIGHYFSIPIISTGDLIRHEIKQKTEIGKEIQHASTTGRLVDDNVIFELLQKRLQTSHDVQNGYILDGFPRTIAQAKRFDQLTHTSHKHEQAPSSISPINTALNIRLRQDIIVRKALARRVCSSCSSGYNLEHVDEDGIYMPPILPRTPNICDSCGSPLVQRADDTLETVQTRLQIYEEQAQPVEQYYENQGKLLEWNVQRGLEDTHLILNMLEDHLRKYQHGKHLHDGGIRNSTQHAH